MSPRTLQAAQRSFDEIPSTHPTVSLLLPEEVLDELAQRVARLLADRNEPAAETADAWMDAEAAARYLGYGADGFGPRRGRQRIYDLVSQRRLRFAKDGSRLLFRRSWLDDYVEGRQTDVEA